MDSELDILSEEMKGQVLVVKVDARGAHNALNSFSVRGTPTLTLFRSLRFLEICIHYLYAK